MLDSETKRRLDNLRDILVGKLPDPKSQVEQITFGLIYKFMYDMDVESIESGGKPSFFKGKYKKYSWDKLFDSRRGGVDRVRLYSEAIEEMYTNEFAPELFREIFKNSFLPFKDPSTLNMFLKVINEFHYSHSEKLGDAYEYLLSYMGSQGDAGQFRTPRHIIDFIVKIVDPKKNERILDPACGTAGFLISSYNHIMNESKSATKLTAVERKKLSNNLVGYDISPDMTRISLVNMYLHNFTNPQIWEYDTLSSEDKWNEYYDVILANPPFFSPKGGIQPHNRFGVDSKRAEVLFVDYIMQHLKPNGRAGVVVPEGIIFQIGRSYKELRKRLIEECLVGVISLPAGVFQPYSGVKTSILILDRELSGSSNELFFTTIETDGFDLGAQRRRLGHSDLPKVLEQINLFRKREESSLFTIRKDEIEKSDFTLSKTRYSSKQEVNSSFTVVQLKDYVSFKKGTSITKKQSTPGDFPVIAGGKSPAYSHNVHNRKKNSITIASSGTAGYVDFHEGPIFASDCFTIESNSHLLEQKFLFHLLKFKQEYIYSFKVGGVQPHVYEKSFYSFQIPLPPLEIQREIVTELDGYQKIIDGARQVVDNYRSHTEIDSNWESVELGKLVEILDNKRKPIKKSDRRNGIYPYYGATGIIDHISEFIFDEPLVLVGEDGAKWEAGEKSAFLATGKYWVNNHAHVLKPLRNKVLDVFLVIVLNTMDLSKFVTGVTVPKLNQQKLRSILIPLPSIEQQKEVVADYLNEKKAVDGNKRLIEIYTKKIQDRIARVWGD